MAAGKEKKRQESPSFPCRPSCPFLPGSRPVDLHTHANTRRVQKIFLLEELPVFICSPAPQRLSPVWWESISGRQDGIGTGWEGLKKEGRGEERGCAALNSSKTVTAYLKSKHLMLSAFSEQYCQKAVLLTSKVSSYCLCQGSREDEGRPRWKTSASVPDNRCWFNAGPASQAVIQH